MTETRLTLARMYRGWTRKRLSEEVGVTAAAITRFEKGDKEPSAETLRLIAGKLGFPVEYFCLPEIALPEAAAISFRARRKMTRIQKDQAVSASAFGVVFSDWLDANFNLPYTDLPDLSGMRPEEAAIALRCSWGLGEQPIPDMVSLLEFHGVRVFSVQEASPVVDAFSFWDERRDRPFVFLTTSKSGERRRMDAAHELGHLVMHRKTSLEDEVPGIEREADAFASALLMPRSGFSSTTPRGGSLSEFMEVKKHWRVSLAAAVYRAHALGLLTDWQFRNHFKTLSICGMRTSEPQPMFPEKSQIASKVIALEEKEHGGLQQLTRQTGIPEAMISAITFSIPGNVIEGGCKPRHRTGSKSSLRII